MRTVLLSLMIAVVAGACSLYFDSHGKSDGPPPDASDPHDAQQPGDFPDASIVDADHTDAGCGDPVDAADPDYPADAGEFPDASVDAGW